MITAEKVFEAFGQAGYGPFLGVPCSFLAPLINFVQSSTQHHYWACNNEGEAVAMAAGAFLAGAKPVVMCQNSGLGNAVSPLTSLNWPFRIPLLLVTTLRGEPGLQDEPQHTLMGTITDRLLTLLDIMAWHIAGDAPQFISALAAAGQTMETSSLPAALIIHKGALAPTPDPGGPDAIVPTRLVTVASTDRPAPASLPARAKMIKTLARCLPFNAALISTTGKISRELFEEGDRPGNFYVVGSMGCAGSIGLGAALYQPERPVVVLDGDGAALMRLEAMASIGHFRPKKLVHLILDNGLHESTGGQPSQSPTVDFCAIATACGYAATARAESLPMLERLLEHALAGEGPWLIHCPVAPGSKSGLGRPTLSPQQIKNRFMEFLETSPS